MKLATSSSLGFPNRAISKVGTYMRVAVSSGVSAETIISCNWRSTAPREAPSVDISSCCISWNGLDMMAFSEWWQMGEENHQDGIQDCAFGFIEKLYQVPRPGLLALSMIPSWSSSINQRPSCLIHPNSFVPHYGGKGQLTAHDHYQHLFSQEFFLANISLVCIFHLC